MRGKKTKQNKTKAHTQRILPRGKMKIWSREQDRKHSDAFRLKDKKPKELQDEGKPSGGQAWAGDVSYTGGF